MAESNLKAALDFQQSGFSVIPINAESKKPHVKWAAYTTTRPNVALLKQWWTKFPDAQIGLITGKISNLVVVDGDTKRLSEAEMVRFHKDHYTPWVVRTGGGGVHYYYRCPPGGARNKVADREGEFDVRGEGGYVVAPPSIHPRTGRRYMWEAKSGNLSALPVFSGSWVGARAAPVPEEMFEAPENTAPGQEHWLAHVMAGVGEGERNGSATRLAGYYFSKGMAYDVILTLMEDWNEKNTPPIGYKELHTIISSVHKTYRRNGSQTNTARPARQAPKLKTGQDPFALMSAGDYMLEHGTTAVTWAIDDWLPDKTIAMAVAPPGSYKTWLTFDAAVSIASNSLFLNKYKVNSPGPVIIVQQEDFHGQIAERLATIWQGRQEFGAKDSKHSFEFRHPSEIPLYLHPDRRLRFGDETVMDSLEEKVDALRPKLIIIDPLYSTGDTDDYMASTVQAMFRIKELRDRYGCSFLLAHHTKKAAEGTQREGLWGSQFLNAFLETGWQLRRRDTEGEILVRRHFKVSQNAPEEIVTFDIKTGVPAHYRPVLRAAKEGETTKASVVDVLQTAGPKTEAELALKTGRAIGEVRGLIRALKEKGSIVIDPVSKRWEMVLKGTDM